MITKRQERYWKQLDRNIDKAIKNNFSDNFMSNAKWLRLIHDLVENIHLFNHIQVKKVQSEEVGILRFDETTIYGFDYWRNGIEGNNSLGGWIIWKEIEYLNFPKEFLDAKGKVHYQDLDKIKEVINSVGQFLLETDENFIKIIAYR